MISDTQHLVIQATTNNEELSKLLQRKLEKLKNEYNVKKEEEFNKQGDSNINFIGFFSYDVRVKVYKLNYPHLI